MRAQTKADLVTPCLILDLDLLESNIQSYEDRTRESLNCLEGTVNIRLLRMEQINAF